MSAIPACDWGVARSVTLVPDRPGLRAVGSAAIGRQRLPTESIGTFTLTLTNVVVDSAIRVELQGDGSVMEVRMATSTTEVFTVPAYATGNAANSLRIKVRKGSSGLLYKPYETLAVASVGVQSIYVSQIPD